MGVLFMDSFDHYTTLTQKGWMNSGLTISAGNGRFSTDGLYCGYLENTAYRLLGAQKQTVYLGCALKTTRLDGPYGLPLFCMADGLADANLQCFVLIRSDGFIQGCRGMCYNPPDTGGYWWILGTTASAVWTNNVYHYIEVKYKIDNSAGEIVVKVDGVEVLNLTSKDTQNTANAYATLVRTNYWGSYTYYYYMDDLWIADDQFYGDARIQCISPTGAGNYAQWTPSAGNNWDCVEEKPPVTTDYISSGTVGQIDTYVTGDVTPTAGTVVAVAGNFYAQKSDAGNRSIAIATRLSSTDDAGSGIALPSSWGFLQDIKATKPGGGAWAIADVNSAEFGVKMIA